MLTTPIVDGRGGKLRLFALLRGAASAVTGRLFVDDLSQEAS
jgi:hypothetical protein